MDHKDNDHVVVAVDIHDMVELVVGQVAGVVDLVAVPVALDLVAMNNILMENNFDIKKS